MVIAGPRSLLVVALIGVVIAVACARPVPARRTGYRAAHLEVDLLVPGEPPRDEDGTARSERSTNLSHITGTARKIQMYVKNKHLQILPDGTVNGTVDDGSDYTILQRTSVNNGQLKIQGVATCLFLCMDSCGLLYGSRECTEDCVFNEMIEQHHYNTYSSARYSDRQRTLYLALNQRGESRKVQLRGRKTLGKMSTYARVLTQPVSQERVDHLVARVLRLREASGARNPPPNPIRHHGYHLLCPQIIGHELADETGRDKFSCRTRKKRKKKKRRCRDDEEEGENCEKEGEEGVRKKRKCDEEDEECAKKAGNERNRRKKCLAGDVECKTQEARDQTKSKNQKKCEKGECKNNEGLKSRANKCEKGGDKDECQRRVDAARDRRRCEKEEDEEECRKRLREARRRRTRARDRRLREGQDDTTKKRKPNSPGKNKKKFVGEGEISKDLDSGRRLLLNVEVATNLNTPSDTVTLPTATSTETLRETREGVASVEAPTEKSVTTPVDAVDQRGFEPEESPSRTIPRPGATTPRSALPRLSDPLESEWP